MAKRKLNETELKISKENLENMKDDLVYLEEVMIAGKQLAIKNAPIVYDRQLKELNREVKTYLKRAEQLKSDIATLQDQIENGVEEKENKKEED